MEAEKEHVWFFLIVEKRDVFDHKEMSLSVMQGHV